jgi:lipopolysaccharide/colanic/teichoic acid biosynthesis glycosyltransferase
VITQDRTVSAPRIIRSPNRPPRGPSGTSGVVRDRRRNADDSRPRDCAERHLIPQLMSADIFRSVLVRERKRADRSSERFILLLLDLTGETEAAIRLAAIEALNASRRETDTMGWFQAESVLGLVLPQLGDLRASSAPDLERRVRGELSRRLDPATAERLLIKVHVHGGVEGTAGFFEPVDRLLGDFRAPKHIGPLVAALKRAFDIVGSLGLLILLSPVMLLIALLVKATSRGPVFFRQERIGQRAKPFTMLKFRSMRPGAGHAIHKDYVTWFIKSSGQKTDAASSGVFKITNDPRITAIGRILRNTSLDELPQFINVLRGEMSLVGPRPPLPYEVEQYKPWHCRRVLEAKPGITGLWQVTGRSRTTFDEMVRLDIRYARSLSLWTDIKILLATPKAVISGKGAC